jgi:hypothetical protein
MRRAYAALKAELHEHAKTAATLAENDPEAFRKECRRLADRFGISVEQAYIVISKVKGDPTLRKKFGDKLISIGARLVRSRFRI